MEGHPAVWEKEQGKPLPRTVSCCVEGSAEVMPCLFLWATSPAATLCIRSFAVLYTRVWARGEERDCLLMRSERLKHREGGLGERRSDQIAELPPFL